MKETKKVWLNIRVNEKEYNTIHDLHKKTTSQSIGEFAGNILLKKPVIIKHRNQSADELLSENGPSQKNKITIYERFFRSYK